MGQVGRAVAKRFCLGGGGPSFDFFHFSLPASPNSNKNKTGAFRLCEKSPDFPLVLVLTNFFSHCCLMACHVYKCIRHGKAFIMPYTLIHLCIRHFCASKDNYLLI